MTSRTSPSVLMKNDGMVYFTFKKLKTRANSVTGLKAIVVDMKLKYERYWLLLSVIFPQSLDGGKTYSCQTLATPTLRFCSQRLVVD